MDRLEIARGYLGITLQPALAGQEYTWSTAVFMYVFAAWCIKMKWQPIPREFDEMASDQGKKPKALPTKDSLSMKERQSLLKLVIGMAVKGYKFDPSAQRNEATSDIAADLDALGIGLDADTVRAYLREAAELLPKPGKD